MLPMTLQFIIVMIASALNDRLQRKIDYVEEERRILQEKLDAATGGKKPSSFTAAQRRRLATAGKLLTPEERRKCCQLVKPATILAWFRQLAARRYLIHDRDPLFTEAFEAILRGRVVRCVRIPARSPNCNPHAERFVETIKYECLNHLVLFGERHLRRDHGARGKVVRRSRLGGTLNSTVARPHDRR